MASGFVGVRKQESMQPLVNLKGWIPACAGMTGYGKKHGVVLLLSAAPFPAKCDGPDFLPVIPL
jgi:hypothetical protein